MISVSHLDPGLSVRGTFTALILETLLIINDEASFKPRLFKRSRFNTLVCGQIKVKLIELVLYSQ